MTVGEEMRHTGGKGNLFSLTFLPVVAGISLQSSSWKISWAGNEGLIPPLQLFQKKPAQAGSMPGISDLPLSPGFPGCTFFIWEPWNIPWLALQSWTRCPSAHTNLGGLHVKFCAAVSLCGVKCACHEIRYCPSHGYHSLDNIRQIRANLPKEGKNSSAPDPKPGAVSSLQHLRLEQWCRHLGFCHLELIKKSLIRIFSAPWGGIRRQQSQCKEQKLLNSLLWQWGLQTLACSYCYPEIFISQGQVLLSFLFSEAFQCL